MVEKCIRRNKDVQGQLQREDESEQLVRHLWQYLSFKRGAEWVYITEFGEQTTMIFNKLIHICRKFTYESVSDIENYLLTTLSCKYRNLSYWPTQL